MDKNIEIAVAGAGIGGLTCALALHEAGFKKIRLYEAASQIRPLGVGINIQPDAVSVLDSLGLLQILSEIGIETRELRYLSEDGQLVWAQSRGLTGGGQHPQLSIHRGELQMVLLAACRERLGESALMIDHRVFDYQEAGDSLVLNLQSSGMPQAASSAADVLIGADGIHSAIRTRIFPGHGNLNTSDIVMWRGLTEVEQFLDGRTMIVASDGRWSRLVAYPISARHALKGTCLLNWVCMVPNQASSAEKIGWNNVVSPEEVVPYFEHWSIPNIDVKEVVMRSQVVLRYPMVDREPLAHWSSSRVTLLGDSAHLMYPIGANGASQAILDADHLAASMKAETHFSDAFERYESARRPVVNAIVLANRQREIAERQAAQLSVEEKRQRMRNIADGYREATKLN